MSKQQRWLKRKAAILGAKKKQLKIFMGYILQLEGGNWYVGITKRGTERLYEHFCGLGAKWTKLHKPVSIHAISYIGDNEDSANVWEKNNTLEMMCQKGYKNVRGYQWCQLVLLQRPGALIRLLAKQFATSVVYG